MVNVTSFSVILMFPSIKQVIFQMFFARIVTQVIVGVFFLGI